MSLLKEIGMNSNFNKQISKTKNVSTTTVLIGWEEGSRAATWQRDSGSGGKVVKTPKSIILSLALFVLGLKTFNSICWVGSAFSILLFKTNTKRGDLGHGFKKKRNILIWDVNYQVQTKYKRNRSTLTISWPHLLTLGPTGILEAERSLTTFVTHIVISIAHAHVINDNHY